MSIIRGIRPAGGIPVVTDLHSAAVNLDCEVATLNYMAEKVEAALEAGADRVEIDDLERTLEAVAQAADEAEDELLAEMERAGVAAVQVGRLLFVDARQEVEQFDRLRKRCTIVRVD